MGAPTRTSPVLGSTRPGAAAIQGSDAGPAAVAEAAGENYEPELEVDLFSLLAAFRGVLERANRRPRVFLPPEQLSIEQRVHALRFQGGH